MTWVRLQEPASHSVDEEAFIRIITRFRAVTDAARRRGEASLMYHRLPIEVTPRASTGFLIIVPKWGLSAHVLLVNQSRHGRNGRTGEIPDHQTASIPSVRSRFNLGTRVRHPSNGAHGPQRVTYARDTTEGSIDV